MTAESLADTVAMRMACPEWPDCADDEGSCLACTEAAAVIEALERGARVEAAAEELVATVDDLLVAGSPGRWGRSLEQLSAKLHVALTCAAADYGEVPGDG